VTNQPPTDERTAEALAALVDAGAECDWLIAALRRLFAEERRRLAEHDEPHDWMEQPH